MDKNDIEELLEKWHKAKQEIALLEKKCEKYKRYSEKILNHLDVNNISTHDFTLKRVDITKATLSKKDVPKEIWNKYSNEVTYPVYYLKPKKSEKKKKSDY